MITATRSGESFPHTASNPCPICRGYDGMGRGEGERCFGKTNSDYTLCTRENFAGQAPYKDNAKAWSHKLTGLCLCGEEHSPAEPRPSPKKKATLGPRGPHFDYLDLDGQIHLRVVKFGEGKNKTFRQCRVVNGREIWGAKGIPLILYRRRELLNAPRSEIRFIVEGEKDADRLAKYGLTATCNPMGEGTWRDHYSEDLQGCEVVIIPDNDEVGRKHAENVARSLTGNARSIKVLVLPGLPEKGDVSDYLERHTIADLKAAAEACPPWTPYDPPANAEANGHSDGLSLNGHPAESVVWSEGRPRPKGLPEVVCGTEVPEEGLKLWTPQALHHMGKANRQNPTLFQRGGILCRTRKPIDGGPLSVEPVCRDALRGILDRTASYAREVMTRKGAENVYGPPPMEIVRDIMSLGELDPQDFPILETITESPTFTAKGELILAPGYHAESRTLYIPANGLELLGIPSVPTPDDVDWATSLILNDLLVDISFANQASRANAVAAMLVPFVREMITGATPDHHYTASTEGTGKGLCANACAFPFLGRDLETNAQKESNAEWRKAFTSFFQSGGSHYFIDNMFNPTGWDNVPMPVDSGALAMIWTSPHYRDRILGGNKELNIKIKAIFMSSGNNVEFSRELVRRLNLIELIANSETPSLRTGFKHDPLMDWAKQNRVALTRACLILCQHWIAQGCPAGDYVMGSFESYARTMGGILDECGITGFLGNRPKIAKKDRESTRWGALIDRWHHDYPTKPVMTAELWDIIREDTVLGLSEQFGETIGDGSPGSQKTRLGKALERHEGRVWGDWRIVRSELKAASKVVLWKLIEASKPYVDQDEEPPDIPF